MTRAKLQRGVTRYGKPKKQVTLPSWDMGQQTAAQNAGKVIEDAREWDHEKKKWVNPNGVKRARRIDLVESYHKRGKLDARQLRAAERLRQAYEATMRSAPAIKKVQVDTFPKPDANIAIQVDRVSKYASVMQNVPSEYRKVITCVVLDNMSVAQVGYRGYAYARGMELLKSGLDALADGLKL